MNQEGVVKEHSMVILSDDLSHDVDMVHQVVDKVVSNIKSIIPEIKMIHYWKTPLGSDLEMLVGNQQIFLAVLKNMHMHMTM